MTWHGVELHAPDWSHTSRSLAMHLAGEHAAEPDCDIYLAANAWEEDLTFEVPSPPPGTHWLQVIDTAAQSPGDIAEPNHEPPLGDAQHILVRARSCVVLKSS